MKKKKLLKTFSTYMKWIDYIGSSTKSAVRKIDSLCHAKQCFSPECILRNLYVLNSFLFVDMTVTFCLVLKRNCNAVDRFPTFVK